MKARAILSKNLRTLIDHARETTPRLGSIRKVAEESDGRLTNGTVGRAAKGSHTTDIDTLADLADVFGLHPWQLLVENLNPKALPRLVDAEFLSQLKQIVDVANPANHGISPSTTDELTLQKQERANAVVGPALEEAFSQGKRKNAGREFTQGQKPQSRRRR